MTAIQSTDSNKKKCRAQTEHRQGTDSKAKPRQTRITAIPTVIQSTDSSRAKDVEYR